MKDIETLRLFTRVARLGSFSAAAREAGLAQSQVSRLVAGLEGELGARLLSRTTRAVAPTEAGHDFLARLDPILAALEDAGNAVREGGELRGLLRIAMPVTMGTAVVIPRLAAFTERHPQLNLDLVLDDRWQDMVREAVDVAIRIGRLPEASGTTRRLATMHRVVVASPAYLTCHGQPETPADLTNHRIVGGPAAMQANSWRFERDGAVQTIDVKPQVTTNDTAGAVAAVTGGLGITSSTSWACRRELDSGALVRLLPAWAMAELPIHAYFPLGRATRQPARVFVDFLAGEFQAAAG